VELLDRSPALLVLSGGRPLSVLTRTDLLTYFDVIAADAESRIQVDGNG
jgi:cystathionine beta-synthase